VSGNEKQTQVVINSGALQAFSFLISSRKNLIRETCWVISNIAAGSESQIQALIDANLIPSLLVVMQQEPLDVKREAAWALSNMCTGGTFDQLS
jgi:importin subunit alpha-1